MLLQEINDLFMDVDYCVGAALFASQVHDVDSVWPGISLLLSAPFCPDLLLSATTIPKKSSTNEGTSFPGLRQLAAIFMVRPGSSTDPHPFTIVGPRRRRRSRISSILHQRMWLFPSPLGEHFLFVCKNKLLPIFVSCGVFVRFLRKTRLISVLSYRQQK